MPEQPARRSGPRFPGVTRLVEELAADARFMARTLRSNRGFAAAAILTLALGVGANTAIFSVVNALLLRPIPYADADRLVVLWNRSPGLGIAEDWFSTAQYFDIRSAHSGFEQSGIAVGTMVNLTGDGEPERVGAVRMSSSLLPMLGVNAARGRLFSHDDDRPGGGGTVVLSHGMWMRRYGGRPGIVGRSITLNGQPFEVVGVLPASFSLPHEVVPLLYGGEVTELFLPLPLSDAAPRTRDREDYNIVGKLRRGVPVAQAQAEMDAITARLRRDHPDVYPPNGGLTFSIVPMLEQAVGGVRLRLYVLMGAVAFVLLVACANVANLLLARALSRRKEFAVRAAFGARRGRIVRQLLVESTVLAVCGGALGVLLAAWSLDWVRAAGPKTIPRLAEVNVDWRVLAFSLAVSVGSGIMFGLVPALRLSRPDLMDALKEAGRGSSGGAWGRGHRTRRVLVAAELALAVLLLIGAALLLRSFATLQGVNPGFDPRGVLTFALQLAGRQYSGPQPVLATYKQIWERLDRLPGVRASGGCTALPLTDSPAWTPISIEGRVPPPGEKFINTDERVVAGRYFEAMGIPLLAGRLFDERDITGAPGVVVVDERFAREFWPAGDAVGKRVRHGGDRLDESMADRRRGRRPGEAPVTGRRPADRPLPPARAGSHAHHERGREVGARPGVAGRGRQGGHPPGRRGAAALLRADDGAVRRAVARAAAVHSPAARRVRGDGAGRGRHRDIRRHGVPRRAGDAGHRYSYGARRQPQPDPGPRLQIRRMAGGGGDWGRTGGGGRAVAVPVGAAVRRQRA